MDKLLKQLEELSNERNGIIATMDMTDPHARESLLQIAREISKTLAEVNLVVNEDQVNTWQILGLNKI